MSTPEQMVENGDAPTAVPVVKDMAKAGDASVPSNPKSLGYGLQQIKIEYWDPENEEYWDVSSTCSACSACSVFLFILLHDHCFLFG